MVTQHRGNFSKFLNSIAFIGNSFQTVKISFLRQFNPNDARVKETYTGVSLKDINIDNYGRTIAKYKKNGNLNTAYDDYVQDKWCPPEDPEKCTMKQCGCHVPDQQCNCPPSNPICSCPDQQCNCTPPNPICDCPDLICPCPPPPSPPWPVPDLICPCPDPPKPHLKS